MKEATRKSFGVAKTENIQRKRTVLLEKKHGQSLVKNQPKTLIKIKISEEYENTKTGIY